MKPEEFWQLVFGGGSAKPTASRLTLAGIRTTARTIRKARQGRQPALDRLRKSYEATYGA